MSVLDVPLWRLSLWAITSDALFVQSLNKTLPSYGTIEGWSSVWYKSSETTSTVHPSQEPNNELAHRQSYLLVRSSLDLIVMLAMWVSLYHCNPNQIPSPHSLMGATLHHPSHDSLPRRWFCKIIIVRRTCQSVMIISHNWKRNYLCLGILLLVHNWLRKCNCLRICLYTIFRLHSWPHKCFACASSSIGFARSNFCEGSIVSPR